MADLLLSYLICESEEPHVEIRQLKQASRE